jgi:hypothetical protein
LPSWVSSNTRENPGGIKYQKTKVYFSQVLKFTEKPKGGPSGVFQNLTEFGRLPVNPGDLATVLIINRKILVC